MGGRLRSMLLGLVVAAMLVSAAPASAAEYLVGGDFEGGTPLIEQESGGPILSEGIDLPNWQEKDDRFVSPICSTATCPPIEGREGGGTPSKWGPLSGTGWAWFGGYGGELKHSQSVMQAVTLPAVEKATLTINFWSALFARQAAAFRIGFDQRVLLDINGLNQFEFGSGFRQISFPLGNVAAGQHNVSFQYVSEPGIAGPVTDMALDDVSLSATPVPALVPSPGNSKPKSGGTEPDTKITKVQLYSAKAGKTGSAKSPKRPNDLYKATQGKSGKPAKAKFTFTGSGGEGGLTFECKLDRAGFRPCTSPAFYKQLKLGDHTFEVRAVDRAGNKDATPATREFKAKQGTSGKTK